MTYNILLLPGVHIVIHYFYIMQTNHHSKVWFLSGLVSKWQDTSEFWSQRITCVLQILVRNKSFIRVHSLYNIETEAQWNIYHGMETLCQIFAFPQHWEGNSKAASESETFSCSLVQEEYESSITGPVCVPALLLPKLLRFSPLTYKMAVIVFLVAEVL